MQYSRPGRDKCDQCTPQACICATYTYDEEETPCCTPYSTPTPKPTKPDTDQHTQHDPQRPLEPRTPTPTTRQPREGTAAPNTEAGGSYLGARNQAQTTHNTPRTQETHTKSKPSTWPGQSDDDDPPSNSPLTSDDEIQTRTPTPTRKNITWPEYDERIHQREHDPQIKTKPPQQWKLEIGDDRDLRKTGKKDDNEKENIDKPDQPKLEHSENNDEEQMGKQREQKQRWEVSFIS